MTLVARGTQKRPQDGCPAYLITRTVADSPLSQPAERLRALLDLARLDALGADYVPVRLESLLAESRGEPAPALPQSDPLERALDRLLGGAT
jgi:hypothetical protein